MGFDLFSILELCVAGALGFWLVGSVALMVGQRKARDKFREKGYLKPPSGKRWFRFLLFKEYDYFEDAGIRFYFGISHFCLMGLIIVLMAIVVFVGSELLLGGVSFVPQGAFIRPNM